MHYQDSNNKVGEHPISSNDFKNITNIYVAKQIFNLITVQLTGKDVSPEDRERFQILSGEHDRLDASDLLTSIYGLNAIAYDEKMPAEGIDLCSMLLDP